MRSHLLAASTYLSRRDLLVLLPPAASTDDKAGIPAIFDLTLTFQLTLPPLAASNDKGGPDENALPSTTKR